MPKTKAEQPELSVRIPEIRLRLEDIVYLRALAQGKATCELTSHKRTRLQLLGLVELKPVPPSAEKVAEVENLIANHKTQFQEALKAENWRSVAQIASDIGWKYSRLEPTNSWVLTEQGKTLLENGSVVVKLEKKGCL